MEDLMGKAKREINLNIDLESEEADQKEIMDLLNLIEIDEAISFEEAFKKEILSFMKKKKAYFNFRYQKKIPLLDYIYNYINASNFNKGKKKTEKRYKKDKLNKNENYNNLKNKDYQNNESLSSNYSFILMNQGSKLDIKIKIMIMRIRQINYQMKKPIKM